jgi:rsbT co-antagonist protein RsbR
MAINRLKHLIEDDEGALLATWGQIQLSSVLGLKGRVSESEIRTSSHDFVVSLKQALASDETNNIAGPAWSGVREILSSISKRWAILGFTPSETATFVFSFKEALFVRLRATQEDPAILAEQIWAATSLLDRLGLYTTEVYQKSREELINRQQQEMLELSTPVVELWHGILALPLIGTLDSARTQIVMQNLLEALVAKRANLAIIDITGVPTVDTLVAQHLLKTVAAARLMGAECIISGIRPQIAQTIIHLGVDLGEVITKANLADAFRLALQKKGLAVSKTPAQIPNKLPE